MRLLQVHELGFGQVPKSYVFKGSKEVTKEQILEQMCFFIRKPKPSVGVIAGSRDGLSAESIARFLLPASECEFVLNSVKFTSSSILFYVHTYPKIIYADEKVKTLSTFLLEYEMVVSLMIIFEAIFTTLDSPFFLFIFLHLIMIVEVVRSFVLVIYMMRYHIIFLL